MFVPVERDPVTDIALGRQLGKSADPDPCGGAVQRVSCLLRLLAASLVIVLKDDNVAAGKRLGTSLGPDTARDRGCAKAERRQGVGVLLAPRCGYRGGRMFPLLLEPLG